MIINAFASGSDQPGSAIYNGPMDPNKFNGGNMGQPGNQPQVDYEKAYKELEQRLGLQGKELGEYRTFFEGVSPLLDTLDKSPQLVQAIIDGKIDESIATAVVEGKVTIGEAKAITQANAEVRQELGKKVYEKSSVDDISKMVEDRVAGIKKEMEGRITQVEEERIFEQTVNDFISRTPDFADYAAQIDNWLDEHEDVTDIKVAYYAVKGELSENEAANRAAKDQAEYAKNQALNAGGGAGTAGYFPEGVDPADVLIAGRSNPNVF